MTESKFTEDICTIDLISQAIFQSVKYSSTESCG